MTDGSLRSHKMSVLTLQLRFVARTSVPVKLNRNSLQKRESTASRSKINTCEFSHCGYSLESAECQELFINGRMGCEVIMVLNIQVRFVWVLLE